MRLEQLQQFIKVAEKGNFRKASRELGISQPALSRSIQNLEHYFGVHLFDRQPGSVVPTYYGQLVLGWAKETLTSSANIKRQVEMLSNALTGSMLIGAGAFFDDSILAIIVSSLIQKYPKMNIRVVRDIGRNADKMIVEGQIDIYLGMIETKMKTDKLFVETFETGPVSIFCRKGHPLLTVSDLDMADVLEYPFVGPIIPSELQVKTDRHRYEVTGEDQPLISIEFDSYAQIRKIVELSDCVGGLPKFSMAPYFKEGLFEELPVTLPGIKHYTSISYLKGRTLLPVTRYIVNEATRILRQSSLKTQQIKPV